jgi:hypothetical protein
MCNSQNAQLLGCNLIDDAAGEATGDISGALLDIKLGVRTIGNQPRKPVFMQVPQILQV